MNGRYAWQREVWAVPVAVAIGASMYAYIFGTLPIAEARSARASGSARHSP